MQKLLLWLMWNTFHLLFTYSQHFCEYLKSRLFAISPMPLTLALSNRDRRKNSKYFNVDVEASLPKMLNTA